MIQFDEEDYKKWELFRKSKRKSLLTREFEMVCQLHSIYKKHNYFRPCTCSPKTIVRWIADLNRIFDNGVRTD
jgi:hypothetical protein